MNTLVFTPATKEQAKARIALTGPTGSGKTYTALVTGTAIGERVALVDTEHGSASKYADEFAFDTLQLTSFEPTGLIDVLAVAAHEGYDTVIVDSLSHFWSGAGGVLEQVDNAAKRYGTGSSFAAWKETRPMERAMIDALLAYPGHLIVTMRTKTEYVVETDDRGRKVPRKVGLKPEQREGIEYEFDVVGDLDHENTLVISKSRAKSLSGLVIRKPGTEFADSVLDWLNAGRPTPSASDYRATATAPDTIYEDLRALYEEARRHNLLAAAVLDPAGKPTTLGDLIVRRGTGARREAGRTGEARKETERKAVAA
ncbi:ATP-binding protein [Streptomyces sp. CNQ085]|uniref:ATP-binding protein n=1 Tax=Streptomyces sp. CNQ085 TaxID=2886944 RepID=UPI001F50AED4|nr:ATP-binding protein [Streptomyces sp. CNQ085]MCI0382890.1 ATP-binding protein [Streptomyces sp. CNQ085]